MLLLVILGLYVLSCDGFVSRFPATVTRTSRSSILAMSGGKIIVSGIGQVDEDEFMLNLLNEQVRAVIVY